MQPQPIDKQQAHPLTKDLLSLCQLIDTVPTVSLKYEQDVLNISKANLNLTSAQEQERVNRVDQLNKILSEKKNKSQNNKYVL